MSEIFTPNALLELERVKNWLKSKKQFTFVRFSDGEIEILRNRYLEINKGVTVFRGQVFKNNYSGIDSKIFDPNIHQSLRSDLLEVAMYRDEYFLKGIVTKHNDAIYDREFMVRLNGGFAKNLTFTDLFLNSNFQRYKAEIIPLFKEFEHVYVIANHRAQLKGFDGDAKLIKIPDNFFSDYEVVLENILAELTDVYEGSLILSSASSLSNILGFRLHTQNKKITFMDIGTSINDMLSLSDAARGYHEKESLFEKYKYQLSKQYRIKW